jgi:YegS/Rv2252/BmrU family lipid kinase
MSTIENKDILFIINPNSGRKNTKKIIKQIRGYSTDFSTVVTTDKRALKKVLKDKTERFKLFVIVGGDGTVNAAVKYFIDKKDKLLAVYPAGSGNGFARELGYKPSLEKLMHAIKNNKTVDVDVLEINNQICINVAGIGYDSFVAHQFHIQKGRGLKNYIIATLKSFFTFVPFNATIITDDQKIKGKYQMISIANTRQFGNNAFISPQSKPDDGIFELVLVKPFPFYLYPLFIIRLFSNTLKPSGYIEYFSVKNQVEIISDFKYYHVDGDPKTHSDTIKIKLAESKIRFLKIT